MVVSILKSGRLLVFLSPGGVRISNSDGLF